MTQGGPFAPLIVFIVALFRGWIILKSQHDAIITMYKERLADKDAEIEQYRTAAKFSVEAGEKAVQQYARVRGKP